MFLDPQRSINHAQTATWPEGPGRCELDCGQSSWSWTFQLAPGCRLGPQPVSGEWGSAHEHTPSFPYPTSTYWMTLAPEILYLLWNIFLLLRGLAPFSASAVIFGHVSRWTLHWEASEGSHGTVQEEAWGDHRLYQEEERGKEASLLQHVPRQNPKQCCCLRI